MLTKYSKTTKHTKKSTPFVDQVKKKPNRFSYNTANTSRSLKLKPNIISKIKKQTDPFFRHVKETPISKMLTLQRSSRTHRPHYRFRAHTSSIQKIELHTQSRSAGIKYFSSTPEREGPQIINEHEFLGLKSTLKSMITVSGVSLEELEGRDYQIFFGHFYDLPSIYENLS